MNLSASFGGNLVFPLSRCNSCCRIRFLSPAMVDWGLSSRHSLRFRKNPKLICRVRESEMEPESNDGEERNFNGEKEEFLSSDSNFVNDSKQDSQNVDNNQSADTDMFEAKNLVKDSADGTDDGKVKIEDVKDVEVSSGSPLPGVKQQEFDESVRIPKEIIEILKDQIFGFDTFFITSQEPYEGGVLFKGNLRGQAARSYEKIARRMEVWRSIQIIPPN